MFHARRLMVAAAALLPIVAFNAPAFAATAHNLETGAHTTNAADGGVAMPKKMMKKKKMPSKM